MRTAEQLGVTHRGGELDVDDRPLSGGADRARERLSEDTETVYDIIIDAAEPLRTSQIYDRYTEAMADPVSKRQMRDYLGKLQSYKLIGVTPGGTNRRRYFAIDPIG